MEEKKGLNVSAKSFVTAIGIIFGLMIMTYILTFMIPGGYISFWKWISSPVLVLTAPGSGTILAVIAFLLVIGGVFNALDKSGIMKYMLDKIVGKFGKARYRLQAMITLFFMLMGAFIGSYEECVPMVPIVVALAVRFGWDALTGLGMSLLAAGCGFASGVCNPFTVGVAQELAGLPMFSGMGFRAVSFVLIYSGLLFFIRKYSKRIEHVQDNTEQEDFRNDPAMDKALIRFVGILGAGILVVLSSVVITVLQDYTMIIVAVMFLVAGILAVNASGVKANESAKAFWQGLTGVLPAVLMILMASSIKFILEEAGVLTTLLNGAAGIAEGLPKWCVILFIYLLVLMMNFFIPSGSAKAFLLMPIIVPIAQMFGISAQLCIVAFAFGDGFSNVFYPTNPVLLISLGLSDISYPNWVKWTWKFQAANLVLTSLILLAGFVIGY